jgi:hypothetical protein
MQKFWPNCALLTAFTLWGGCDAPALVGKGGECISLSECALGLTCVAGHCSDDLTSLEGETPEYEDASVVMDAESDAPSEDAGVGDASAPADAAAPRDASTPRMDSSVPDASVPRDASVPDAGKQDSAVPDATVRDAESEDAEAADAS